MKGRVQLVGCCLASWWMFALTCSLFCGQTESFKISQTERETIKTTLNNQKEKIFFSNLKEEEEIRRRNPLPPITITNPDSEDPEEGKNETEKFLEMKQTFNFGQSIFGKVGAHLGEYKLKTDRELYFSEDLFCSKLNSPPPPPLSCIPCDYSVPSTPDGICLSKNLNGDNFSGISFSGLPNCKCFSKFCAGTLLIEDSAPLNVQKIESSSSSGLYRFSHSDWNSGFAVRVVPIVGGPFEIFVSLTPFFDPFQVLGTSSTRIPLDEVVVCPSHPLFQAKNSVTYYIFVFGDSPIAQYRISIESVPLLIPYEEELPAITTKPNITIVGPIPIGNSPILMESDNAGNSSILIAIFPLTECRHVTFHMELLELGPNMTENNLLSFFGYFTASQFNFNDDLIDQINFIQSTVQTLSSPGHAHQICPKRGEPTFLYASVQADLFWKVLIFVRDSLTSQYLNTQPISSFTTLRYQQLFHNQLMLSCPCQESDNCDALSQDYDYISRQTLIDVEHLPSLLYPSEKITGDYVPQTGILLENQFYFRCNDRSKDTPCGITRVVPLTEYANPKIFPIPDVVGLLDSGAGFVDSFEMETNNSIVGNGIGFLVTIRVGDKVFFDMQRIQQCSITFASPSLLHGPNFEYLKLGEPLPQFFEDKTCNAPEFNRVLNDVVQFGKNISIDLDDVRDPSVQSEEMSQQDLLVPRSAMFATYAATFSEEWQRCTMMIIDLLVLENETEELTDTAHCFEYDPDDPCCNIPSQWYSCCDPQGRNAVISGPVLIDINETAINDQCENPDCTMTFANDYLNAYGNSFLDNICSSYGAIQDDFSVIFATCIAEWLGDPPFGKFCQTNEECALFGEDSQCDFSVNRCLADIQVIENGFLSCLIDRMDSISRSIVFRELAIQGFFERPETSLGPFHDYLTPELLQSYASMPGCVSDYGPNQYRPHFEFNSFLPKSSQICPICFESAWCLSTFGCAYPTQCNDRSNLCEISLTLNPGFCVEIPAKKHACNWNSSLFSDKQCETGTYKCMYCHNSSHCELAPFKVSSQEECEALPLCILSNGTLLWDVSQEDCENLGSCSEACGTTECETQEECETKGGRCIDSDNIQRSVELAAEIFPSLAPALGGVCLTPLSPDNHPSCPNTNLNTSSTLDFTSSRGCVRFSVCGAGTEFYGGTKPFPASCIHKPAQKSECETDFGGKWLELPLETKERCINPLSLSEDDLPGFCDVSKVTQSVSPRTAIYLAQRSKQDCLECGGIPVSPAKWSVGRWFQGNPVSSSWMEAKRVPSSRVAPNSISYLKLNHLFSRASLRFETFINQIEYSCVVEPFLGAYAQIVSSCANGSSPNMAEKPSVSPEFEQYKIEKMEEMKKEQGAERNAISTAREQEVKREIETTKKERKNEVDEAQQFFLGSPLVGGVWFCPNVSYQVGLVTGIVFPLGDYIVGDLCKYSDILLAPDEVFVGNHKRTPRTLFGDPNKLDPYPVRNQEGASVGRVIGSGILFDLAKNIQPVIWREEVLAVSISFVADLRQLTDVDVPPEYVLDFGVEVLDPKDKHRKNEIELRPLDAKGPTMGQSFGEASAGKNSFKVDGVWVGPFETSIGARLYPIARMVDWKEEKTDSLLTEGEKDMVITFAVLYGVAFVITVIFSVKLLSQILALSNLFLCVFMLLCFLFRCIFLSLSAAGRLEETSPGYFILLEPPGFFLLSILTVLVLCYAFCVSSLQGNDDQAAIKWFWRMWGLAQVLLYTVLAIVLVLLTTLDTSETVETECFGRISHVEKNNVIEYVRIGYHSFILFITILCSIMVVAYGKELRDELQTNSLLTLSLIGAVSVFSNSLLWVIYSSLSASSAYVVIPLFFTEVPPLLIILSFIYPSSSMGMTTTMYEDDEDML